MYDSVRSHLRQPTRLPRPWHSPGKNTGVGCHFLLQCMKVKSESEVAQSYLTLSDPMDCSLPGSSVNGFSRQEYWSGVPLPSPVLTFLAHVFLICHGITSLFIYSLKNILTTLHALEKEMATHSSVLAWRITGTGEPGGLPSMGSQESDMTETI